MNFLRLNRQNIVRTVQHSIWKIVKTAGIGTGIGTGCGAVLDAVIPFPVFFTDWWLIGGGVGGFYVGGLIGSGLLTYNAIYRQINLASYQDSVTDEKFIGKKITEFKETGQFPIFFSSLEKERQVATAVAEQLLIIYPQKINTLPIELLSEAAIFDAIANGLLSKLIEHKIFFQTQELCNKFVRNDSKFIALVPEEFLTDELVQLALNDNLTGEIRTMHPLLLNLIDSYIAESTNGNWKYFKLHPEVRVLITDYYRKLTNGQLIGSYLFNPTNDDLKYVKLYPELLLASEPYQKLKNLNIFEVFIKLLIDTEINVDDFLLIFNHPKLFVTEMSICFNYGTYYSSEIFPAKLYSTEMIHDCKNTKFVEVILPKSAKIKSNLSEISGKKEFMTNKFIKVSETGHAYESTF